MDQNTLAAMHALVQKHFQPTAHAMEAGMVLLAPSGHVLHDLEDLIEKHRPYPKRAKGTSTHHTLDSLIEHAKRHKVEGDSVVFCSLADDHPVLEVVYDYHPSDEDRGGWGEHRACYEFPLSEAWRNWLHATRQQISVAQFAELLENGISDVRDPSSVENAPELPGVKYATPSELLTLASGLNVRVEQYVVEQRRPENGTATITFAEQHTNDKGEPLKIPTGFLIGIPVFLGGTAYAIPVRLRYRILNRAVMWSLTLHDAETAKRDAITEAAKRFANETKLPLFYGTPDDDA